MKLLKIHENKGHFLGDGNEFHPLDQIKKEDILKMVNQVLTEDVEMDEFDENVIKNPAHQVIYKSVYKNLKELQARKREFIDESERLYLADYERYNEEASQQVAEPDAHEGTG